MATVNVFYAFFESTDLLRIITQEWTTMDCLRRLAPSVAWQRRFRNPISVIYHFGIYTKEEKRMDWLTKLFDEDENRNKDGEFAKKSRPGIRLFCTKGIGSSHMANLKEKYL